MNWNTCKYCVTYIYSTWARATSSPLQNTTSKSFCRRTNILIKFPAFSILIISGVLIFRVQNWMILNDFTGFAGLNSSNVSVSPGKRRGCCEFKRYRLGDNCLLTKRVAMMTDSLKLAGCCCSCQVDKTSYNLTVIHGTINIWNIFLYHFILY